MTAFKPLCNPYIRFAGAQGPDPRVAAWMHRILLLGVLLVLILPAARASSAWLGWMPLWLVGMPLSACWALHGFRLPRLRRVVAMTRPRRRRRGGQARRRSVVRAPRALVRAA